MIFYLQDGLPDNTEGLRESRMFLDDYLHVGCMPINTYEADRWVEAREQVPL